MVREVKGHLTLLGNSKSTSTQREYSVIEIGGEVLQDISISTKLDNFLSRSLNWDGECVLYLVNGVGVIFAVKTPDGKTYTDPEDGFFWPAAWFVVFAFAALAGLAAALGQRGADSFFGWVWLIIGAVAALTLYKEIAARRSNNSHIQALKEQGAIEIK